MSPSPYRAGKPIATVSTTTTAILEDDLDKHNGHVTGQVDMGGQGQGQGQELGYLNIRWSYPTDGQAGVYGCSVVGITASGHSVILTRTLEVKTSSISLADLVMEIRDLKKSNTDLQAKMAAQLITIGECQSKMASQQNIIGDLQSNMSTQQHDIDSQHATIVAQQTTIGDLQSKMAATQSSLSHQQAVMQSVISNNNNNMTSLLSDLEVRLTHVETGAVTFGDPGNWDSAHTYTYSKAGYSTWFIYQDVHISFKTPYHSGPPVVTWAVGLMDHRQDYLRYSVDVRDVTTTGCVIRAGVLDGHSDFWFDFLIVEWTSIPR